MPSHQPNPPRIYIVGTNTAIGKTTFACELLRAANRQGLHFLPVKPAQSGALGETSDIQRLCAATTLDSDPNEHCFFDYHQPLAPGIAHNLQDFLGPLPSPPIQQQILQQFTCRLKDLETSINPHLTLIEGAGGLHVPMPGGTWQSTWIQTSQAQALIIAHSGLGTINHSLLTINALRTHSIPIFGLFLCDHPSTEPLTRQTNLEIIERFGKVPVFGCLPSFATQNPPDDWISPLFWTNIRSLLSYTKRREDSM